MMSLVLFGSLKRPLSLALRRPARSRPLLKTIALLLLTTHLLCPFVQGFTAVYPQGDSLGPFLYLGNEDDGHLEEDLRLLRIKHILMIATASHNATDGRMVLEKQRDRVNYEFLLQPKDDYQLSTSEIMRGVEFIEKSFAEAHALPQLGDAGLPAAHVLIVSRDGCNRAGTIAAAYVLRKLKLSVSQAVSYVRQARSCFQPTEVVEDNLYSLIESPDQDDAEEGGEEDEHAAIHASQPERRVSARVTDAMRDEKKADYMNRCQMLHDAFWYYGDLEPLQGGECLYDIPTAADCCQACDDHPECAKWSYGLAGKERKRCYLKRSGDGYLADRPHFLSGRTTLQKKKLRVKDSDEEGPGAGGSGSEL
ncbi:unnamed protein product [Amoebophrya sp. A25]|nr:unnamed protein product [Amoebophrya sp. A25]|eukprot:GSA25T00022298001.1